MDTSRWPVVLAGASGAIMLLGGLLSWATASVQGPVALAGFALSRSVSGVDLPGGQIVLALGISLVVLSLAVLVGRPAPSWNALAIVSLLAGVVALVVTIADAIRLGHTLSLSAGVATGLMPRFGMVRSLGFSPGAGLWFSLIGGVGAATAASWALFAAPGQTQSRRPQQHSNSAISPSQAPMTADAPVSKAESKTEELPQADPRDADTSHH